MPTTGRYEGKFRLQRTAREGEREVVVDRKAAETLLNVAKDGDIPQARFEREVLPTLFDAHRVGKLEAPLVDLIDVSLDGRVHSKIEGVRVRLAPETEAWWVVRRDQLRGPASAPPFLDEPAYRTAVAQSVLAWFEAEVRMTARDDSEYSAEAQGRDLARARRLAPFPFDEPAGRPSAFTITPPRPESVTFYQGRQFLDRNGDVVPADAVRLVSFHMDPELAGEQMVEILLAVDRRDGSILRTLERN